MEEDRARKVSVPIVILPFGRLIIIGCRPDWKVEISKLSIPRLWEIRSRRGEQKQGAERQPKGELNAPFLHTRHNATSLDSLWPGKYLKIYDRIRRPPFLPPFFDSAIFVFPSFFTQPRAESTRTTTTRQLLFNDRCEQTGNNPRACRQRLTTGYQP